MESKLTAYINFKGNTRTVMEFYHSVFGGKLAMNTFEDFHAAADPSENNLIMHSQLDINNGMTIMAADLPDRFEYRPGTNFSLTLSGDNYAEIAGWFEKLSAGGKVTDPLTQANRGDTFGSCVDQFGINWMVNISRPQA